MKKVKIVVAGVIVALSLVPCTSNAQFWKSKKKKAKIENIKSKKTKKESKFDKLVKGADIQKGLFNVIKKDGKFYFEIPLNILDRDFLLASRVSTVSNPYESEAGRMPRQPILIKFSNDSSKFYIHKPQLIEQCNSKSEIYESFRRNHVDPIWKAYSIKCYNNDSTSIVVDLSKLFCSGEKSLDPWPPAYGITAFMKGGSGSFNSDRSKLLSMKAFENNINIKSRLTFTKKGEPLTFDMTRNIIVLPKEQMKVRYHDERIGFFYQRRYNYSNKSFQLDKKNIITKWDIQPKPEELNKYLNGEMVEPAKPIVWYVDPAIPKVWRKYIKLGIQDWQKAFEEIGFKNAIVARDYPTKDEDPNFDPDDIKYTCYRYVTTWTQNSMGPSWVDPRSGEIICGDVMFYSNVVTLLQNWLFVQTGAVDPKVREQVIDPEVMGKSLRYVAAHEVGHTLGLMHNFGASAAFPVDSLRSPKFTQKYGTTPSIMDYARNNYVAQPGDLERGVRLSPPDLGVYDKFAIKWGYKPIFKAETSDEEYETLNKWIVEKKDDPMYHYGPQTFQGILDPYDISEDLGDDPVKAAKYGIKNLKLLVDKLPEWVLVKNKNYERCIKIFQEINHQYYRYMDRLYHFIGGIRIRETVFGDGQELNKPLTIKQQKDALNFLFNSIRDCSSWLNSKQVVDIVGSAKYDANVQCAIMGKLVDLTIPYKLIYNEVSYPNCYTYRMYSDDLFNLTFRKSLKHRKLDITDKNLQNIYVQKLADYVKPLISAKTSRRSLCLTNEFETKVNPFLNDHVSKYAYESKAPRKDVSLQKDATANTKILGVLNHNVFKVHRTLNKLRKTGVKADRDHYNMLFLILDKYISE